MLKRINQSDIPDSPAWSVTMVNMLNNFMQTIDNLINGQITFEKNIKCEIKEFSLNAPIVDYFISSKLRVPKGVLLLSVLGDGIVAPSIQWEPAQSGVRIALNGLTNGNSYKVRILVI